MHIAITANNSEFVSWIAPAFMWQLRDWGIKGATEVRPAQALEIHSYHMHAYVIGVTLFPSILGLKSSVIIKLCWI
jgi:hypothetical protein